MDVLAGDPEAAVEAGFRGIEVLEEAGEQGWLSTLLGLTAEALYLLGRDAEAWELTEKSEAAGAADDVITQMLIRQVRATLLARRGALVEAQRLAGEAVELGAGTDALEAKANALRDLALVLTAAEKHKEALGSLIEAQRLYEQKGHTVGVARMEALRAQVSAILPG